MKIFKKLTSKKKKFFSHFFTNFFVPTFSNDLKYTLITFYSMIKQRSNNFSSLSCVTVPKTAPPPTKTACPPTFTVMPREVVTYQFLVRFSQIFFHWCIVWSRLFPNTIGNFSVDFTSMFKVSERYAYRFLRQTKNHDRTTPP